MGKFFRAMAVQHFYSCSLCGAVDHMCAPANPAGAFLPPPCSCCSGHLEMVCDCGGRMSHRLARDATSIGLQLGLILGVGTFITLAVAFRRGLLWGALVLSLAVLGAWAINWIFQSDTRKMCEGLKAFDCGAPVDDKPLPGDAR
jgi:hypothetical protein